MHIRQHLQDRLIETKFDFDDWRTMAAGTRVVLEQLALDRSKAPLSKNAERLIRDLDAIVRSVLKPTATRAEIMSACEHADRVRRWLIDELTTVEQ